MLSNPFSADIYPVVSSSAIAMYALLSLDLKYARKSSEPFTCSFALGLVVPMPSDPPAK